MADSFNLKATDWKMAFIGGAAGFDGGGGLLFVYHLESFSLQVREFFCFGALGVGLGGNASGTDALNLLGLNYSDLNVFKPFSVNDLHGAGGRLISGGLSFPGKGVASKILMNSGWGMVEAMRLDGKLFSSSGLAVTAGSTKGGNAALGLWFSVTLTPKSINESAYGKKYKEILNDGDNFLRTVREGSANIENRFNILNRIGQEAYK